MSDRLVDVPGVGQVAFPATMSDQDVVAAIERDILPKLRSTPAPPVDPNAKPGAPDYGGPGGARREWNEQPPAPQVVEPTIGERIGRQLNFGTRAVGRGAANIVGLPVDIPTLGANAVIDTSNLLLGTKAPLVKGLPGSSESIQNAAAAILDRIGVSSPEPTKKEKLVGDMIEGTASAIGPAVALRNAAVRQGSTGVAAENMNPLVRPYGEANETARKMAPGLKADYAATRPLIVDAAAGAGAGAGQNAAGEYFPDSPLAASLLSLLGGTAGATGVGVATAPKAAVGAVRDAVTADPNVPGASRRIADQAARTIQEATIDPQAAAANIRGKYNVYADAGVAPPTAGLLSEDPGLVSVERGLRQSSAGPKFTAADQRTRSSLAETVAGLAPDVDPRGATVAAEAAATTLRGQSQQGLKQAESGVAATGADARTLRDSVAAGPGADDASKVIDQTVRETLKTERDSKNALFTEAKKAGADVPRDVAPLQQAADEVRAQVGKLTPDSKVLPKEFLAKIDEATQRSAEGGQTTYADVIGLRPALSDAIAAARAENQGAMVEALTKLKGEVEKEAQRVIADAAKPGADPKLVDLAGKLQAADANYKDRYAPNFVQGEGGKLRADIARDPTGTATQPSQTAKRFISTEESAADLARILEIAPNKADGMKGVRDYIFSRIAATTLDGDKVNETRLNKWVADHRGVLKSYPQVEREVADLQARVASGRLKNSAAEAQLSRAKETAGLTEKAIQESGLGLMLGKDPQNAVESVFSAGDPQKAMRSIVVNLGGKDGKAPPAQAWKRAVADWVEQKVTNQNPAATEGGEKPVSLAKLGKIDDRYDKVLAEVFTPGEMNSMRMVRQAATDLSRLQGVRATAGSNTAEDVRGALNLVELIAKSQQGVLRGGGTTRVAKLLLSNLGLMDEGVKANAVLGRAMHDPQLAAHLLERPTGKVDRSLWNRKLNTLLALGAGGRESGE